MANGKKIGQNFEQQIKKSAPDYVLFHRLPDPAQSFINSNQLRFSRKNKFDYIAWDSHRHILYALELKTVKDKSISFERTKGESSKVIHHYQIEGLNEWNKYDGIVCGFIIEFRKIETTVFIDIADFNKLINIIPKKSFNFDDLKEYGIKYQNIDQRKVRTQYTYDLDNFFQSYRT
jgi:hypothetical protein